MQYGGHLDVLAIEIRFTLKRVVRIFLIIHYLEVKRALDVTIAAYYPKSTRTSSAVKILGGLC